MIIFVNNLVIAIIIYLALRSVGAVVTASAIALAIANIGLGASPVWVVLELSAYAMAISRRRLIPIIAATLIAAAVMEPINTLTKKT